MARQLEFFYFDLGNVLLDFDHQRAAEQMAGVAGISSQQVWEIVFRGDLEWQYECGRISTREFYEAFCRHSGTRPDYQALLQAAADIFEQNRSMVPLVEALRCGGNRLGVLSNTNELHWQFVSDGRFALVGEAFEVHALSYQLGKMKPDAQIYADAARLAGVAPDGIFFVDDRRENVAAAVDAGFDAVLYEGTGALIAALQQRAVIFNF